MRRRRQMVRVFGIERIAGRPAFAYERFTRDQSDLSRAWVASAPPGFERHLVEVSISLKPSESEHAEVARLIEETGRPLTKWLQHHHRRRGASFAAVDLADKVF